jgi:chorismate--pyruvate lyase
MLRYKFLSRQSFLFNREPHWRENRAGLRQSLSPAVQSWTYETGSLTQRLRHHYGNKLAVKVLVHHWRVPFLSERRLLKQTRRRLCLVREVLLHVDNSPLILARTIMPIATVNMAHGSLLKLGNRPIGEVIFSYPQLKSQLTDLTLIPIDLWTSNASELASIKKPIHGRRTVHNLAGHELIVSEFFLPTLLEQLP